MTLIQRRFIISCLRCGDLIGFSYTPGDQAMPEANLVMLFDKFKKHQRLRTGHFLRFSEKKVPVRGT